MRGASRIAKDLETALLYLGILLLILFSIWLGRLWKKRHNHQELLQDIKESTIGIAALTFLGCGGLLLLILLIHVVIGRYVL